MFTIIFNSKQRCDNVYFTSAKVLVFLLFVGYIFTKWGINCFFICKNPPNNALVAKIIPLLLWICNTDFWGNLCFYMHLFPFEWVSSGTKIRPQQLATQLLRSCPLSFTVDGNFYSVLILISRGLLLDMTSLVYWLLDSQISNYSQFCEKYSKSHLLNNTCNSINAIHNLYFFIV